MYNMSLIDLKHTYEIYKNKIVKGICQNVQSNYCLAGRLKCS